MSSKLPDSATKVFQGEIFAVYQWPQELYDGSTATFEKIQRPDTAGVIAITPEQRIVITHQEQPTLGQFTGLLGGVVDPGETPLEAAKRELKEEAGLESVEWSEWFSVAPHGKMIWTIHTFVARNVKKVVEPQPEPGEKIRLEEVSFERFLEIAQTDSFRDTEITFQVLRALVDPTKMAALKQALFG